MEQYQDQYVLLLELRSVRVSTYNYYKLKNSYNGFSGKPDEYIFLQHSSYKMDGVKISGLQLNPLSYSRHRNRQPYLE